MNLTDARAIIRGALKSGADTNRYQDNDLDIALRLVGNHFVNATNCVLQRDEVPIVANDPLASFAPVLGFRPEFTEEILLKPSAAYPAARIGGGQLARVGLADVRAQRGGRASTGVPTHIGFASDTAAELWPTPVAAGTLEVFWHPRFTPFAIGAAGATLLNIPDHLLDPVLTYGAAVIVQLSDPEAKDRALKMGAYNDHVLRSAGTGGRGARSFYRRSGGPSNDGVIYRRTD